MNERRHILQSTYEKLLDAEEARRAGDLEVAERIARDLSDEHPAYWGAQHTVGLIHFDRAEFDQAYDRLSRAMRLSPENPLTLALFARTCLELGACALARRTLDAAIQIAPENPHVLFACGEFHRGEDKFDRAAEFYQRAIAVDREHAQAATGLAVCLRELGMVADAASLLESQLPLRALDPLHQLSELPAGTTRIDILAELDKLASPLPHKTSEHRVTTSFIRASALHDRRKFHEAWSHLLEANRLAIAGREAELDERQGYERATLEATRLAAGRYRARQPELGFPTSLFILGPSRSGKSTVERLLATIDGVHPCFECRILEDALQSSFQDAGLLPSVALELLPPELHEDLRERYFRALLQKDQSSQVFTVTKPGLISEAVRIAAVIPNIRFIVMKRQLEDTLLRILMKSYKSGNVYAYDLEAARRHIIWYNEMIDVISAAFPHITLQVRYEDVIENPANLLVAAAQLLGLHAPSTQMPALGDDRDCAAPYRDLIASA